MNELFITMQGLTITVKFEGLSDDGGGGIQSADFQNEVTISKDYEVAEADFVEEVDGLVCGIRDQILMSVGINPDDYYLDDEYDDYCEECDCCEDWDDDEDDGDDEGDAEEPAED